MTTIYVESSAALAWILGESAGGAVIAALRSAALIATSALTLVEVRRSLCRYRASRAVTEEREQRLLGALAEHTQSWNVIDITPAIQTRAGERFPVEPVRSLDAIHIATILELVKAYPDVRVLSFDDRVLANVAALGLTRALPR